MYKSLIRPFLFSMEPEKAHNFTFTFIKILFRLPLAKSIVGLINKSSKKGLERELFGLKFPNPVGLAAGLDKDAILVDELATLGFGFIEIGTLTPRPQLGNPLPRMFRLPKDQALINRMGFNNKGVEAAVEQLKKRRSNIIVGGNIGKNKDTPNEEAVNDYIKSFNALFDVVDYFVVNVSSPNTPGLRALQDKEPLTKLLVTLQEINNKKAKRKPILLKIAPDLGNQELDDIVEIVKQSGIDGIIATNTTISREGLKTDKSVVEAMGAGGLSGKPVRERSTQVIKHLVAKSGGSIPIIAVGGIHSAQDAKEKLDAGASLVQLYTGFIYEGPALIKEICEIV